MEKFPLCLDSKTLKLLGFLALSSSTTQAVAFDISDTFRQCLPSSQI